MSGEAEAGRGLFIVFEGVEGAGKSTQVSAVARRLQVTGVDHLLLREPGGTEVGDIARATVLNPRLTMCDEAELFLYLTSRAEFVRRQVRPALAEGRLVLSDRYELSTFAYQGAARGLDMQKVREANALATGGMKPDLTILLRLDPVEGRERQSGEADRLESERAEFHAAVAEAYDRFARLDPRIVAVGADGEPEGVHERIWSELSGRWPAVFAPAGPGTGNFSAGHEFEKGSAESTGGVIEATGQEAE